MMQRHFTSCLATAVFFLFVFVLAVPTVSADTLNYGSYPFGLNDGAYYVGNAKGNLNGHDIVIWCIDALHLVTAKNWEVDVVNLANPGTGLDGLLPGLDLDDYQAMFLLGKQFTNTSSAVDSSLQHIIWSFAKLTGYSLSAAQLAQKADALASVGNYDFSEAQVLVPHGAQSTWTGQIFETGSVSPVPEPASLGLLGTGLVFIGMWARRRLNKQ